MLYCRWSVIRRKISEGANDTITGEVSTPFRIHFQNETIPVPLDRIALHLSDNQITAWTTQWEGLPERIQNTLRQQLPKHIDDALYHCEQATLPNNAPITWSPTPAFITDLDIAGTRIWSIRRPVLPLLISAVLAISAAAF